jgi:DNA-binding transcriptional MerR regulator
MIGLRDAANVYVTIGEVRHATGMTSRAIRLYDELGLIKVERDHRRQRHYDRETIDRLIYIQQARLAGLSLPQVGEILQTVDREGPEAGASRARDFFLARRAELETQWIALEASASRLGIEMSSVRPRLIAI